MHTPRKRILGSLLSGTIAALALTAAGSSHAVTLLGITSSNELARIDTTDIASATRTAITGLAAGDRFVGIDLRPKDNLVYGVTLSNKLYTLDGMTGVASFVAALSTNVVSSNLGYGIDFNPVADYGSGASLRFVSSAGANVAINVNAGANAGVVTTQTAIASGFTAVAYANSTPLPTAVPASTQLYYIDSNNDTLSVANSGFGNPSIGLIGALGVDVLKANGFELLPDGRAFAALNVDAGTSLTTGIYSINLMTGAATNLGTFNGTLSGLTVAAVPEPGTYALMLAGLGAVGFMARRRRV